MLESAAVYWRSTGLATTFPIRLPQLLLLLQLLDYYYNRLPRRLKGWVTMGRGGAAIRRGGGWGTLQPSGPNCKLELMPPPPYPPPCPTLPNISKSHNSPTQVSEIQKIDFWSFGRDKSEKSRFLPFDIFKKEHNRRDSVLMRAFWSYSGDF